MGQLESMEVFVRVVDAGSITRAADQLDLAKSAVSRHLKELEEQLGVKLLYRTTRQSSLTEAGTRYYHKSKLVLDEVNELNTEIRCQNMTLEGKLKLAAPMSFGLAHLTPAIDDFMQKHPELQIEVDFSDRKVDIIEEGFDLALRIGQLEDSSLHARKITEIRHRLCASTAYLDRHGSPQTPEALKAHTLLRYFSVPASGLRILDAQRQEHIVPMESRCVSNNGDFLKAMALSGHGIVYLPSFLTWQEVLSQQLVVVLDECQLPLSYAYAIYPPTRYLPLKARVMIDFLSERFGDTPYWDQAPCF